MFCRYTNNDHKQLKEGVVYYLEFKAAGFGGEFYATMPGMYNRRYETFEEFQADWEIV